ncbi:MAG TPA: MarR family transcriptional regulator [Chthonomonas sp.]|uniref:MarR family winged helix-turn-helix transcriptional regulator n=1 Tax=Chthonomonas sp. TaxID=2282153 RepID=UPI002B4AB7A2|nr:MarR family transcriptional regulator [Chthonomonas sp.]HLI47833.1 MarR family transcriptional regulator [Chthonomonas sp.]
MKKTKNAKTRCCKHTDLPLERALIRVVRATMFVQPPLPEMDALPMAQMRLLWMVYHMPQATMKEFSEKLEVSQSTVTQLADRLIRRGLIVRFHDSKDRRLVRLSLSEQGHRLLEESMEQMHATLQAIWNRLGEEERPKVIEGLEILGRVAEQFRVEQGRAPLTWREESLSKIPETSEPIPQPMVDLMARRIRGNVRES